MADITRKRTGELLRKLFEILIARPEGMQARDALEALVRSVELTPYEAGNFANGARRFERIVRFATIDAVKAGWLVKTKGRWSVTEAGRAAFNSIRDPEGFYKEAVHLYHQWKASRAEEGEAKFELVEAVSASDRVEATVEERSVEQTFEEAEDQAWDEIKRYVQQLSPYDLQGLIGSLLQAMGHHLAWNSPPGKDGGVDLIAYTDPLGIRAPRIKVQVKRHKDPVGVEALRAFLALLGDEDVGLFVSTGGFTTDALTLARSQEKRKITLIDLDRLLDLWIEHYKALDEIAKRRLPLRPIYFLAPAG